MTAEMEPLQARCLYGKSFGWKMQATWNPDNI